LFPEENIFRETNNIVHGYVRWMATLDQISTTDDYAYQRRGLNSLLLAILQSSLAWHNHHSKSKQSITAPSLFARHGFGTNEHDPAVLFWQFSGFMPVTNVEKQFSEDTVTNLAKIAGDQACTELVLVHSNQWIWDANKIKFPNNVDIHTVVGNVVFPHFDLPPAKEVIEHLSHLRPCKRPHRYLSNNDFDSALIRHRQQREANLATVLAELDNSWTKISFTWTQDMSSIFHNMIQKTEDEVGEPLFRRL
jgi:hypothetical protein